ncbi:hypothetical protein KI387_044212 [Taxus chinensis]|uniref:Uncharacterized protein n=1 Tax=Taxus chinensis TaxID=29808 RepID=A0AA38L7K5_TAXCH|nr:hypothetical protein KI387_044212 [Taxus chinensis]
MKTYNKVSFGDEFIKKAKETKPKVIPEELPLPEDLQEEEEFWKRSAEYDDLKHKEDMYELGKLCIHCKEYPKEIAEFCKNCYLEQSHERDINKCEEQPENFKLIVTSPQSTYINTTWKFKGYKAYNLHAYLDTGAGMNLALKAAIPEELWQKGGRSMTGNTVEGNRIIMDTYATNIPITIGRGRFVIKMIWQCECHNADILLGNEFLLAYSPFNQTKNFVSLQLDNQTYYTERVKQAYRITDNEFLKKHQSIIMDTYATNIPITIGGGRFVIKMIWQCECHNADILLGNEFLLAYSPFNQTKNFVSLQVDNETYYTERVKQAYRITDNEFLKKHQSIRDAKIGGKIEESLKVEEVKDKIPILVNRAEEQQDFSSILEFEQEKVYETEIINKINNHYANIEAIKKQLSLAIITQKLQNNISINPLLLWEKDKARCNTKFIDPHAVVRVRPMYCSDKDRIEFKTQLQEQLKLGLIRPSLSIHSSPAFCVRNHAETLRGKARIVINYKKLNDYTISDGYFIPNIHQLISRIKNAKIFSKLDCKSGYWQIKMSEEAIPLTVISSPQGQYEWLAMPFGLKNAPNIFQ